jgi:hypothetical protein
MKIYRLRNTDMAVVYARVPIDDDGLSKTSRQRNFVRRRQGALRRGYYAGHGGRL